MISQYKYPCAKCGEFDLIGGGMKTHKCSHCGYTNKLSYDKAVPVSEEELKRLTPVFVSCPYCNTVNAVMNREHQWKCAVCHRDFQVFYNDDPQPSKLGSLFSSDSQTTQVSQNDPVSTQSDVEKNAVKKAGIIVAVIAIIIAIYAGLNSDNSNDTPETKEYSALVMGGVKSYLKYEYLRDPKSYEDLEWSQIGTNSAGELYVRHKYRAKNGFGGYNVEERIFFLDKQGHVLRSQPYVP